MNPFDYVNSISSNKKNMMRETENDELAEKGYTPFLCNKALSYHTDTILYANEMNMNTILDHKLQYEYLLHSIRKGRRFSKWTKKLDDKEARAVSRYFNIGLKQASEYLTILDRKTIEQIVQKVSDL
jgi:hypothetical protein